MQQSTASKNASYIVFVALLLDLIAFTIILPLLPSILDFYDIHSNTDGIYLGLRQFVDWMRKSLDGENSDRVNRKLNTVLFGGLIGSLFSLLQFFASPIMGALSDRYGRKPVLLVSLAGSICSYLAWARATSFTAFLVSRIIGGLCKGNVSVSIAIMTDLSAAATRGHAMALVGIAFSVGFTVGPMLGAYFIATRMHIDPWESGEVFWSTPAYIAVGVTLISLLVVVFLLPETLPPRSADRKTSPVPVSKLVDPVSLFLFRAIDPNVVHIASVRLVGIVYFLYLVIFSGLEFTLTFLAHSRFDYTSKDQGKLFCYLGLIMFAVQGGYVRRIEAGRHRTAAGNGIALLSVALITVGVAAGQATLYAGVGLFGVAASIVVPCLTTVVSQCAGDDQRGTLLGIFRSLGALSRAIGPATFSTLYWLLGPTLCYCVGAVLLAAPYLALRRYAVESSHSIEMHSTTNGLAKKS